MKPSFVILAIAPGKREIGIAVFRGFELCHFSITEIKRGIPKHRLKDECAALAQKLIYMFGPGALVFRAISGYQESSLRLKPILKAFRVQAGKQRVPLVEITLAQVRTTLCPKDKPTQKIAFQNLCELYPGLRQYLDRPSAWQNQYYTVLLSAVAIGFVYLKLNAST
jgi:hypothetical protein